MPSADADQGRDDATFLSGGTGCEAWVYRPETSSDPGGTTAPAIVMAHGLGCIRDLRLPAYAERFRDAGGKSELRFDLAGKCLLATLPQPQQQQLAALLAK